MQLFLGFAVVNQEIKNEVNFEDYHFHNILQHFNALSNFNFTTC